MPIVTELMMQRAILSHTCTGRGRSAATDMYIQRALLGGKIRTLCCSIVKVMVKKPLARFISSFDKHLLSSNYVQVLQK